MAHDSHDHNHSTCAGTAAAPCCSAGCGGHSHDHPAHPEWRYGLALLLALAAEALHYAEPAALPWQLAGMVIAACAIALAGFSTYRAGLVALRQGRLGINALMAVAVTGAFAIGQWPEAAMVMALYAVAELIEERSVERARGAIQGLMRLAPEMAEVRQSDGRWALVAAAQVQAGQVFRVKPGERIALDATLTVGTTTVNQAAITGESLPLERSVGDALFAGTVNLTATIEAVATSARTDSLLERIIRTVEQAQAARAPTQTLVDRFAAMYTPTVFAMALAVAVLGPLALDWPWLQGVYKALVLLVISCPCALVISTPVAVVSALTAAARRGILVKGGVHLENARKLRTIAFDKTGTLTEGRPRLVEALVLPSTAHTAHALHWAADMAAHSKHPVSVAIAQGLAPHACDGDLVAFESLPGLGVKAQAHGTLLWLGNHRLVDSLGVCNPALEAALAAHEAQGHTVTVLASRTQALALLAVADTLRPSARQAIAELHAMGIETTLLSGDNQATADTMARAAGLAQARGGLLPHDKLAAIATLQQGGHAVAMVGDGINDAPALAASNLGIAMGGTGTDIAMETADVALLHADLRLIPELVALSRRTHGLLVQNIALALAIKTTFLVLAVLGSATMWMAVFADMGASLLVVGNSLRLLRTPPRP